MTESRNAAEILAQGHVAHIAFIDDGQPVVIPFSYHFDAAVPEKLYIHGKSGGRATRCLESGDPVCVTVTLLDALVYSRTAFNHTMNYRSVVCFGRGRRVTEPEIQHAVFERMVLRYFPGRTAGRDYSIPTPAQLDVTSLVEIRLEQMTAKAREGGPLGPLDALPHAPGTSGIVPLQPW
jgi:uncharacterized protein